MLYPNLSLIRITMATSSTLRDVSSNERETNSMIEEKLPIELFLEIAHQCDHDTLAKLASVSVAIRDLCFDYLFKSIKFRGIQPAVSRDLAKFISGDVSIAMRRRFRHIK